ncbi:hypothetical protein M9H77_08540 [Catharanthus roseus]|uniref:Uncharacterized protein n=1 Tax=Catharanthus roseus TaxID=4058 RepID=A0ACC0BY61_CATRO|nr:hypothetical protein M9H77_08540 [Catharanthus roseus]
MTKRGTKTTLFLDEKLMTTDKNSTVAQLKQDSGWCHVNGGALAADTDRQQQTAAARQQQAGSNQAGRRRMAAARRLRFPVLQTLKKKKDFTMEKYFRKSYWISSSDRAHLICYLKILKLIENCNAYPVSNRQSFFVSLVMGDYLFFCYIICFITGNPQTTYPTSEKPQVSNTSSSYPSIRGFITGNPQTTYPTSEKPQVSNTSSTSSILIFTLFEVTGTFESFKPFFGTRFPENKQVKVGFPTGSRIKVNPTGRKDLDVCLCKLITLLVWVICCF